MPDILISGDIQTTGSLCTILLCLYSSIFCPITNEHLHVARNPRQLWHANGGSESSMLCQAYNLASVFEIIDASVIFVTAHNGIQPSIV